MTSQGPDATPGGPRWSRVAALAAGHSAADFYAMFLPPLLPVLKAKLGLTAVWVGAIPASFSVPSSMLQVVFGYLGDRQDSKRYIVWGIVTAAVFISGLGFVTSRWQLIALLFLGGLGISAFHPTGAKGIAAAAPNRRALAMSVFLMVGTAGLAAGPIVVAQIVERLSLGSIWITVIPGLVIAFWLWCVMPPMPPTGEDPARTPLSSLFRLSSWPTWIIFFHAVLRSAVFVAFSNFVPLYFNGLGRELSDGAAAVTVFVFAGCFGGMAGGWLSERIGSRTVLFLSTAASSPFLLGFLYCQGMRQEVALFGFAGFVLSAGTPVTVVTAQKMNPNASSLASALTMGVAWAVGSLMAIPVSAYEPRYGFRMTLAVAALLTIPAAALVPALPKMEK